MEWLHSSWTRTHRVFLLILAFTLCNLITACSEAQAADNQDTLKRTRIRQGIWLGGGLAVGKLKLLSESASSQVFSQVDITQLPVVAFGADLWPEEELGVYVSILAGTGADVISQQRRIIIDYNAHQVELGGRYRWFFGPQADSGAFLTSFGLRGLHQSASEHPQSVLVTSTAMGPELALALEQPLGNAFWFRLGAHGGLPFFFRESPTDSGDPQSYLQYGGRLDLVWSFFEDWGLQVTMDYIRQEATFIGEGTRSVGIEGAETTDQFISGQFNLRKAF